MDGVDGITGMVGPDDTGNEKAHGDCDSPTQGDLISHAQDRGGGHG